MYTPTHNPPLPASALMDITTAQTIIREVFTKERPLSGLHEATLLLTAAMGKLRTSHHGHTDFSNPPEDSPIKILNVEHLPNTGRALGVATRIHFALQRGHKMATAKDVEKILLAMYPGKKITSHYSLRPGAYPGVKHAYGAQMEDKRGAKHNPPATLIYKDIVEIYAVKPNGERFFHKFRKGSSIYGLPDGDILIRSRKGKRLWKKFEMEG